MNTNEKNRKRWPNFKTFVRDFNSFPPKRKLDYFYKLGKLCGYMIGVRFFGDCKVKWFSYLCGVSFLVYFFFALYTSVVDILRGRFVECLPSWCMSGLFLSVCFFFSFYFNEKFWNLIKHFFPISESDCIYRNSQMQITNKRTCISWTIISLHNL